MMINGLECFGFLYHFYVYVESNMFSWNWNSGWTLFLLRSNFFQHFFAEKRVEVSSFLLRFFWGFHQRIFNKFLEQKMSMEGRVEIEVGKSIKAKLNWDFVKQRTFFGNSLKLELKGWKGWVVSYLFKILQRRENREKSAPNLNFVYFKSSVNVYERLWDKIFHIRFGQYWSYFP